MSAVPAAIDALVAVFTAAAPVGVDVIDGDPRDPGRRFLCVAWDESDNPVASASVAARDLSLASNLETFDVTNLLTVWSGSATAAEVRADAFDLFTTFRAALKSNRDLDGVVEQALVTTYEYAPSRPTEGVLAQIRFTVTVLAFTTE